MKQIVRPVALALLLCPSCSDRTSSPGSGSALQREGPLFLSIGTAPPGGAFFVVGGAIAETLHEHQDKTSWNVTAEATMGSQENIRRLAAGELDLALSNASITYFATRGEGGWTRPYALRSVMTLAPNVAFFIAHEDSGVKTIKELKGKRVVMGPAGAGFEYFLRPLLAAHGIRYKDFVPLHGTQATAVDMLADKSASAAFLGGAVPTASIVQACASQKIFFVPFDKAARSKLAADYPFFNPAVIPRGTYPKQKKDFHGLDVGSMHLITSEGKDEELIYNIARILYENRTSVARKHAAGKSINPTNVIRPTGTEFHPGAIRYYREIGIWPLVGGGSEAVATSLP